jgi:hypothetical protein
MRYTTLHCSTVKYSTVHYSTVQSSIVQLSTVLYCLHCHMMMLNFVQIEEFSVVRLPITSKQKLPTILPQKYCY